MAAETVGGETPTLFLRNATGLVRGWSVRDSMIYACLATNFVTLAIYEFAFAAPAFPKGQLITSVLISGVWVSFLVIAYAGLVVTIPRAGGDYVWQTRILGSGLGFVMAATGWWFILWLWAPIYGNILAVQFFEPLWATMKWTWPGSGATGGAAWFGTHTGIFLVSLITIVLAGVLVSIGMAGYAKFQRWCFYGGLVGFAVDRGAAAGQLARELRQLVQPGDAQALRPAQRVRGTRRPRPRSRLHADAPRLRPAGADHAPGSGDDVLHPVAELGRDAVRRDPRRERLQAGSHRHVRRPVDYRRADRGSSCC